MSDEAYINRVEENIRYKIQGDLILEKRAWRKPMIARAACTDCGKRLYNRELPEMCSVSGKEHYGNNNHSCST